MKSVEAMKKGFVEMGMPEVADAIRLSATDDDELGGDEDLDADLGGEELDMGPEAEEAEAGLAPSPEEGGEEGEEDIEALDEAGIYMESTQGDVVNEVARRVARRLLQARSGTGIRVPFFLEVN